MKKTEIAFRTGIVLVVLAVFAVSAVPAVNAATAYFVPEDNSAETGNYNYTYFYIDIEEGEHLAGGQMQIQFNPMHANITKALKGCVQAPGETCWGSLEKNFAFTGNGYLWGGVSQPQVWNEDDGEWVMTSGGYFEGPATIRICKFKVEAQGTPGVSPFNFGFEMFPEGCSICQPSEFGDETGTAFANMTWINGTFTHEGEIPSETFEKTLVAGWNLISLPLTNETDMTVANIIDTSLSGSYDYLNKYDASTHSFVALSSSDTMENGVGYFIHMTSADTWTYTGSAYTSMSTGLSQGLNMVGWLNCSKDISDGLSSIDGNYYYVARWNATSQSYETYNPAAPPVFNDFTTMDRGEGYFISAKGVDTLSESC